MKLLVLGGTWFVGRAIVEEALDRAWNVTTFNRGQSGRGVVGAVNVHGDRTCVGDIQGLAEYGPWDALVDTSGYVPRNVLNVASSLLSQVNRYVFMSTVSVYKGWPAEALSEQSDLLHCPPDADSSYGEDVEDGPTRYGYQKSGCESAVTEVFGESRSLLLRPGVVLGPREYVGRLPWWLRRIAKGGPTLAPGSAERRIQPVDVRDLAEFTVQAIEDRQHGAFNIAANGSETFGGLLNACIATTHSSAELIWMSDDRLLAAGVRQWSEMPLWRTAPGTWAVAAAKAQRAGLRSRPLVETVGATWEWMNTSPEIAANERSIEIGIDFSKEQAILGRR
ncbi:NAD-dependent epimerase/dehydratase family protein [Stackebrandtia nassauensis]|uniref:NAD-dependent epimerase/dehydratase n=1 Tax=Stackebrandtia nassauensis (strain DSM 44728 / CIP 108903 / NRRL B-16338 / NBRC 102104 / LLR-40K-21) TaxID=446470 RepID=D3Q2W3_STANL|nr:NAD-dependent epimerase/dehydratase family protein [Stackebrandtia nassauensis]ADD45864.1 NAD-dependent epimerase/dehydratase [Stackebrandtia nassauensis DSM 44728]